MIVPKAMLKAILVIASGLRDGEEILNKRRSAEAEAQERLSREGLLVRRAKW